MRWWIKLVLILIVIAVLGCIALSLGNSVMDVIGGLNLNDSEPDPMFETVVEMVTRPPEIYPEETQKPHKTLDDYVPEEQSPVDKTAQQLIQEAQAGQT